MVWQRLVRFIATDDSIHCGEPEDANVDVGVSFAEGRELRVRILSHNSALRQDSMFTGEVKAVKKLLSPVTAAEAGTIRCIGLNYRDHAAEMKFQLPTTPELFMKAETSLHGPADPIHLPTTAPTQVDAEVELAVIIGKDCKNVPREDALQYVLGYTVANDLTTRDVQKRGSQWSYCKSFDGFCPLGPALVTAKALPDPSILKVKNVLNGKTMQSQVASDMIFSVAEIIEHLSKDSTLRKGTVILTGTPAGIGASHDPPIYLRAGDDLRVSISHGLGTLVNPIVG